MGVYTDTGLTNGTTYYYTVVANNAQGDSPDSAQVSATPGAAGPPPASPGWYPYGAPPNGRTLAQVATIANASIQSFLDYCYVTTGMAPGATGGARIAVPDAASSGCWAVNGTFSEGQGYGQAILALCSRPGSAIYRADARDKFDALMKYTRATSFNGLMWWRWEPNGTNLGASGCGGNASGSALDGDFDLAMSLVWMNRFHESSTTGPLYGVPATQMINAIGAQCFLPANHPTYPNVMKPGSQWSEFDNVYMSDYFRVAFMREFYVHTGDTVWLDRINANYPRAVTHWYTNYPTGYVPDASNRDGGQIQYPWKYGYNSIREHVLGPILDWLWNGNTTARDFVRKFADAERNRAGQIPANARAERDLNGNNPASYINAAYMAGLMEGGLVDSSTATWANDCITFLAADTEANYFGRSLKTLALIAAAGEMKPYQFGTPAPVEIQQTSAALHVRTLLSGGMPTATPVQSAAAQLRPRLHVAATGTQYVPSSTGWGNGQWSNLPWGSPSVTAGSAAALNVRAHLAGTAVIVKPAAAQLKIRAQLQAATPTLTKPASAAFNVQARVRATAGSAVVSASAAFNVRAQLQGHGGVAGGAAFNVVAHLAATGTLVKPAGAQLRIRATLSGTGVVVKAAPPAEFKVRAKLSGAASDVFVAGAAAFNVKLSLSGGEAGATQPASAAFRLRTALVAAPTLVAGLMANFNLRARVQAGAPTLFVPAAAAFNIKPKLEASATNVRSAAADFNVRAHLAAAPTLVKSGQGAFNIHGLVVATATLVKTATAEFKLRAHLAGTAVPSQFSSAAFNVQTRIAVQPGGVKIVHPGKAAFNVEAKLSGEPTYVLLSPASGHFRISERLRAEGHVEGEVEGATFYPKVKEFASFTTELELI